MERYYRIQFTAKLQQMLLAFKMECDIEVFWKRGQKVAQSGKIPFKNCTANFNKELRISCNMVFDNQKQQFKEKQTKFAIVIYTEKGNKQAGQIIFDVAPFLNEKNQQKFYQLPLTKCPDKNAKLNFLLKAQIMEEKQFDTISQNSSISVNIQTLTDKSHSKQFQLPFMNISKPIPQTQTLPQFQNKIASSIVKKKKQAKIEIIPTTDRANDQKSIVSQKETTDRQETDTDQKQIKNLQKQNKKIQELLKKKESLRKQNQEYKRRLQDDDYQSCKQYKKKIEQGKKQIENLIQQSKGAKKLNQEIKKLQKQILKCKERIMKVLNQSQKFGPGTTDKIQKACGFKQY